VALTTALLADVNTSHRVSEEASTAQSELNTAPPLVVGVSYSHFGAEISVLFTCTD